MMRATVLSVLAYTDLSEPVTEVFSHQDLNTIPDNGFVTVSCTFTPYAGKLKIEPEPFEGEGIA